ncbi:hypothetical protein IWW39_004258 [Coemansia spiralis]|uniref:DNA mismatch repair proteins mutS family domain-containing protein n=1 Tax=Coemansia spiralis TaxID=417178 RepID=A0A9W8GH35_9FUNG|nr:hypothetical protein IWW39_004258 [Coemansia spiralis]
MTKALDISAIQVVDNMFVIKQTLADVILHPRGSVTDKNLDIILSEQAFDSIVAEKRLFGLADDMPGADTHSIELDECINESFVHEHRLSVGCAGALLAYVSETTKGQFSKAITVKTVHLKSFMLVDTKTLEYLGVFDKQRHPNMHSQAKKSEGMSLFRFLDRTRSADGRDMLKNWVMCPLQALAEISERQAAISFLAMDMHSKTLDEMCGLLAKVKSIKLVCLRIQTELLVADLESLAQFAYAIVKLHGLVASMSTAPKLIRAFLAVDQSRLAALGAMLIDSVDFDTSRLDERIVIAPGVSSKVDHLREKFGKLDELLQIALIAYMAHIGSHVPAKRVLVGLTDRVLALGKTTESLSRRMSTLSTDLSSVAKIAELASAKSLVLLDEFGRGTAPVDGISLLCGALASLSLRSDNRPSVLAATHFQGR